MIISRTPFRISFAGGGTDLRAFYQHEPGAVTSTTINKYMYITVNKRFDHTVRVSYSRTEIVETAADEIVRGVDAGGVLNTLLLRKLIKIMGRKDGSGRPLDVKVGDKVLFEKFAGSTVKVGGDEYMIMREDEILAILED